MGKGMQMQHLKFSSLYDGVNPYDYGRIYNDLPKYLYSLMYWMLEP